MRRSAARNLIGAGVAVRNRDGLDRPSDALRVRSLQHRQRREQARRDPHARGDRKGTSSKPVASLRNTPSNRCSGEIRQSPSPVTSSRAKKSARRAGSVYRSNIADYQSPAKYSWSRPPSAFAATPGRSWAVADHNFQDCRDGSTPAARSTSPVVSRERHVCLQLATADLIMLTLPFERNCHSVKTCTSRSGKGREGDRR